MIVLCLIQNDCIWGGRYLKVCFGYLENHFRGTSHLLVMNASDLLPGCEKRMCVLGSTAESGEMGQWGMSCFLQLRGNHTKHLLENIKEREWSKRSIHPVVEAAKPERPSQRPETGVQSHHNTSVSLPATRQSAPELPRGPQTQPSTHPLIAGYHELSTSNSLLIVTYSVPKMMSPAS